MLNASRIVDVRAWTIHSRLPGGDYHAQEKGHWICDSLIANPMSVYPEYRASRTSWGIGALGSMMVEIEDASGETGFAVGLGGPPGCYIVEKHLKRLLVGQDARRIETLWDRMWRATLYYGRKGLPVMAISLVDLALWDLRGKRSGLPVWKMIGGRPKKRIPMYATTIRPDLAKKFGFWGAKIPLPHGPADGSAGLRKNVGRVAKARRAVGDDFELMIDCYMALDVSYTIRLARALKPFRVKWIEEYLPPDDYDGHAAVRRAVRSCLLATGEHEYTRWGFQMLLDRRCADILQPDLGWCGGLTEALRIATMARKRGVLVVPHGSSVYSYHFVLTNPNSPFAEFLVMSRKADRIVPMFGNVFLDEPVPVNGLLEVPDRPGWGVRFNRAANRLKRPFPEKGRR